MSDIHVGDVVELLSGGCDMCVIEIDETQQNGICCVWFNAALEGLPHTAKFSPNVLKTKTSLPNRAATQYFHGMQERDVVKLRSGSPSMTVNSVDGHKISCIWFDGGQTELLVADFQSIALMKV